MGFILDLKGQDGIDGQPGHSIPQPSQGHGQDGTNAGYSSAGLPGGQAFLRLQRDPNNPEKGVLLHGVTIDGQGQRNDNYYQAVLLEGPDDKITIDCRGGRGGHGGRGGRGQDGANGFNGVAASRTTNGTNGSDGCDGGHGGMGTDASDGAAGGHIEITLQEEDMDLLFLLEDLKIQGGEGGQAGAHGEGGEGGQAGKGGSPCAWTTEVQVMQRDAYGQMVAQVKIENHYNHGGDNGAHGRRGRDGQGQPTRGGNDGLSGKAQYFIEHNGERVAYEDKFRIQIVEFSVKYTDDDGVVEPGEVGHIDTLKVQNVGYMPTPIHSDILIQAEDNEFIKPIEGFYLPRRLEAGQLYELQSSAKFQVKKFREVNGKPEPYQKDGLIKVQAYALSVEKFLPEATMYYALQEHIEYPLRVVNFQCLATMSPGQRCKVIWTLVNIANRPIGGIKQVGGFGYVEENKGNEPEHRKACLVVTAGQGEFPVSGIEMEQVGVSPPQFLMFEYAVAIPEIHPNQEVEVEAYIKIPTNAMPYTSGNIFFSLELSDKRDFGAFYPIHKLEQKLNIGFSYQHRPNVDILFVVNSTITQHQLNQLISFCSAFGLEYVFWDISVYEHFDMFEPLGEDMSPDFIAKDMAGKTIIFFDGPLKMKTTGDQHIDIQALDHLSKEQMLRAISEFGVHFVLFQKEIQYQTWSSIYKENIHKLNNIDQFLEMELGLQKKPLHERLQTQVRLVIPTPFISFNTPPQIVEEFVRDLSKKLKVRYPMYQYIIYVEEVFPNKDGKAVGTVRVIRNVSQLLQFLTVFPEQENLHTEDVYFAIINGLPLERKTHMLLHYIRNQGQEVVAFKALKQNIAYTLCNEIENSLSAKEKDIAKFSWLNYYATELIKAKEAHKELNMRPTEDVFVKINEITQQTGEILDAINIFSTRAGIHRKLAKIVNNLKNRVYAQDAQALKAQEKMQDEQFEQRLKEYKNNRMTKEMEGQLSKSFLISDLNLKSLISGVLVDTKLRLTREEVELMQRMEEKREMNYNNLVGWKKYHEQQFS